MEYNYYLEIATVILMLVLTIDIRYKKQLYRLDTKIFANTLLYLAGLATVNYLSCMGLSYPDAVPRWVNILLAVIYFVMQALVTFGLVLFVIAYPNNSFKGHRKMVYHAAVAFALNFVLSISSAWNHFYFYVDENNVYSHGKFRLFGYLFYLYAMLLVIIFVYRTRHSFIQMDVVTVVISMVLLSIAVLFQIKFHLSLVIDFATAICLLLIYITMENPNFFRDKQTGCNNLDALRQFMNNWDPENEEYHILTVSMKGNRKRFEGLPYDESLELKRGVVQYLKEMLMDSDWLFAMDDSTYSIVSKHAAHKDWYIHALGGRYERPWRIHNGSAVMLKMELAVCSYPMHFTDFNSLVDLENYLVGKLNHGNKSGIIYADDNTSETRMRFEAVEEALQKVIAEDLLQVHYQPIYDISQKKIVSLEALSRIDYPGLGKIPPMEFISVAEATGLINDLGLLVIEKVCSFIHNKLSHIHNCSVQYVEVNLSPLQLMDSTTIPQIKNILKQNAVDPAMLKFEITESATADSPEIVEEAMKELLNLGCSFALDDYGTGYSNINYLVRFPFSDVKFDKGLIWSYFQDKSAHIIMEGEFNIINNLGKNVIAEGIETEEQMLELHKLGVNHFQGFYFSRALPDNECMTYLLKPKPEKMFSH